MTLVSLGKIEIFSWYEFSYSTYEKKKGTNLNF